MRPNAGQLSHIGTQKRRLAVLYQRFKGEFTVPTPPQVEENPFLASTERDRRWKNLKNGYYGRMEVLMYSAPWCRDCRETKRYLDTHGVAFTEIDIEANPSASEEVLRHVGKRAIPQLVIDGEWFQPYKPGLGILYDELDERFGIKTRL